MATTQISQTVTVELAASDARLVAEILGDYAREITREDDSAYAQMLADAAKRVAAPLHSAGWGAAR